MVITSKKNLLSLFLACIFPIHLWSLVIIFRNLENVITRTTNVFDGFGYASYSMLLAFFECTVLFLLVWLLSALLPRQWPEQVRLAQMVWLAWLIPGWAAIGQLYPYWFYPWQKGLVDHFFLWLTYRRAFYPVVLLLSILLLLSSVVWPFWLLFKSEKFQTSLLHFLDRIKILSVFYLALDALALLLVIFRNVWVL